MKTTNFRKGYYQPKNPDKYIGDLSKIIYRSSWELHCFNFLDNNIKVLKWSSEPVGIPYLKPTDNKLHKYYPDLYVQYINKDNEVISEMLEIKPSSQTVLSKARKQKTRLYENIVYAINQAKWEAARAWCNQRNIQFRIVTEQQLFMR